MVLAKGTCLIWDIRKPAAEHPVRVVTGQDRFRCSASSSTGRWLVTDSSAGIEVRDLSAPAAATHPVGKAPSIATLTITDDARFVVSGSSDGVVRLWDAENSRQLASFHADSQITTCAVVCRPDPVIIYGTSSGAVHFLRLEQPAISTAP